MIYSHLLCLCYLVKNRQSWPKILLFIFYEITIDKIISKTVWFFTIRYLKFYHLWEAAGEHLLFHHVRESFSSLSIFIHMTEGIWGNILLPQKTIKYAHYVVLSLPTIRVIFFLTLKNTTKTNFIFAGRATSISLELPFCTCFDFG